MRRIGLDTVQPRGRLGRAPEWLTALGMLVAMALLAFGGVTILDFRADAWHRTEQASETLVAALTRSIGDTVTRGDVSLRGTIEALGRPDIDRISSETRDLALFGRAGKSGTRDSLAVLNSKGEVIASSPAMAVPALDGVSQDYFRVHRERPDAGLFIGLPVGNPMRHGEAGVALSRRVTRPDGTFGGVAVSILPLTYFTDLFGGLDPAGGGSVTLVRSDGRVIVRFPLRDTDIDRDMGNTPLFQSYAGAGAGHLAGTGSLDGVDRLYTFRHLPGLPLILSAGVPVHEIDAAWTRAALALGAVLAVFCGVTILLALRLRREYRGRMEAETMLRGAAVQMAMAPVTDGLTGLANRKSFEERLTREWGRAIRAGTPIALVILDADLFKGYNDRYGHSEGDQVLRSVAACIAKSAMRPSDTNARFGGDEFALLLPETDLTGASVVAERIRVAVAALALPYEGRPTGHVTVSVGVTIARPSVGDPQASLVARADTALNAAKDAGRNIVGRAGADGTISVGEQPLFRQPSPPLATPQHAARAG